MKGNSDRALVVNFAFGPISGLGGTERRMLDVAAELTSRGHVVRALVPAPAGRALVEQMARAGAEVVLYRGPFNLVRRIGDFPADVTWVFGARVAYPLAVSRRLRYWRGGQLFVAKNGLEPFRSRSSMLVERLLMQSADLVVANSQAAADLATARSRVHVSRVRVLASALSSDWVAAGRSHSRAKVRIAMIGNAVPEKEHALGARMFAELNDPGTSLDVFTDDGAGIRSAFDDITNFPQHRVKVHEGVMVNPEIVSRIDVLLHPSSSESLPRVALEARSQGAWVVGFDVGDLGRFTRDQVSWGADRELRESLAMACADVRAGRWPEPPDVLSVPEYTDRMITLIQECSPPAGKASSL